ncbi:Ubiquitin-protein ligase [Sarcoptes scabiei]|nr:Ubiquitin-protein ligase [Sarcoptes scabiei]
MAGGHTVRFDRETRKLSYSTRSLNRKRRRPYQSQPILNRLGYGSKASSLYRLNHLNPTSQKQSLGKSYVSLRNLPTKSLQQKRLLFTNRHVASVHKLISNLQDEDQTFTARLRNLMNTYNFQIFMVVLIILDCVMVLGEMIIELKLFQNDDCKSLAFFDDNYHEIPIPGIDNSSTLVDKNQRLNESYEKMMKNEQNENLFEQHHHHHLLNHRHYLYHRNQRHDCEHQERLLHNVEHIFHLTSIFILFLFNIELLVRLYAEGHKYFLNVEIALDSFIVIVSFDQQQQQQQRDQSIANRNELNQNCDDDHSPSMIIEMQPKSSSQSQLLVLNGFSFESESDSKNKQTKSLDYLV